MILVFFLFNLYLIFGAYVDVNFYSSGNIDIYQPAFYYCSVNDTRVSVSWSINGSNTIAIDIIVNGTGSMSSTLTIPGLLKYNNTLVRCYAGGIIEGKIFFAHNNSTLRIQGAFLSNIIIYMYIKLSAMLFLFQVN